LNLALQSNLALEKSHLTKFSMSPSRNVNAALQQILNIDIIPEDYKVAQNHRKMETPLAQANHRARRIALAPLIVRSLITGRRRLTVWRDFE